MEFPLLTSSTQKNVNRNVARVLSDAGDLVIPHTGIISALELFKDDGGHLSDARCGIWLWSLKDWIKWEINTRHYGWRWGSNQTNR